MLTSTLVSPNALNLKLPGSNSKTVAPSTISVSVTSDGAFYVNKDKVDKEILKETVVRELRKEDEPQKATIVYQCRNWNSCGTCSSYYGCSSHLKKLVLFSLRKLNSFLDKI